MKKALIITSVASMISQFNMENIKILQDLGLEITVATNFNSPGNITNSESYALQTMLANNNIKCIQVDFPRGMGKVNNNLNVMKKLKEISLNNYDIIHCQSPIASVLTRITFRNQRSHIIYTAHGFHFYRGGPKKSWLLFYPLERYLSRYADTIITINSEDKKIAGKFHSKFVEKIPGVGIDFKKFSKEISLCEKNEIKKSFALPLDVPIFISVGELNENKNQITVLKALRNINFPYYYLIVGIGKNEKYLKEKVREFNLQDKVKFIGYSSEVEKLYKISDLAFFLSIREGLGLAGLESLASGVPLISSNSGGIKEYSFNNITGYVTENPVDFNSVETAINLWFGLSNEELKNMKKMCKKMASGYDIENVSKLMKKIYLRYIS